MKHIITCIIGCSFMALSGSALAAKVNYCGELKNHYGPLDFRNPGPEGFPLVENAHFTAEVENGISGSTGPIGGDIDYTLRAIPNHHRALETIGKISIRDKKVQMEGARYPTECYYERAIRFAPTDGIVRAIYGNYLARLGRNDEAIRMFLAGSELAPDNATISYNLGLLYMKTKQYDKAAEYASKAYSNGFPLPGLRNQLAQVGKTPSDAKAK